MKPDKDDPLLGALREHVRSAEGDGEDDALAPLDAAAQERIVERALAAFDEGGATETVPGREGAPAEAGGTAPAPSIAPVRWLPRVAGLVSGLAVAAALVFYVVRTTPPDEAPERPGDLPAYDIAVSGGRSIMRSEPQETILLQPGAPVVVTMRPAARVEGGIEARAFLVRDGAAQPLDLEATVTTDGAVRLTGSVGRLPLPSGPAELVVSVARRGVGHQPTGNVVPGSQRASRAVRWEAAE